MGLFLHLHQRDDEPAKHQRLLMVRQASWDNSFPRDRKLTTVWKDGEFWLVLLRFLELPQAHRKLSDLSLFVGVRRVSSAFQHRVWISTNESLVNDVKRIWGEFTNNKVYQLYIDGILCFPCVISSTRGRLVASVKQRIRKLD